MGEINSIVIIPDKVNGNAKRAKGKMTLSEDDIVWPPTVIIENTRLAKTDDGRWTGIGNIEMAQILQ
ncbi:hypothetical protein KI387_008936, partial [Taxus chinensis]